MPSAQLRADRPRCRKRPSLTPKSSLRSPPPIREAERHLGPASRAPAAGSGNLEDQNQVNPNNPTRTTRQNRNCPYSNKENDHG